VHLITCRTGVFAESPKSNLKTGTLMKFYPTGMLAVSVSTTQRNPFVPIVSSATMLWLLVGFLCGGQVTQAGELLAGVAKMDISDRDTEVNDPLFAKALVLKQDATIAVLVTIDAVAIGEIGRIKNDFLGNVRTELQKTLQIPPASVLINASHCHGVVCADVEQRTIQAVQEAWKNLVPVRAGTGVGQEVRIMENRRLRLKDGSEADVRHAYAMPRDEDVIGIGPVDPEIGLLRLDRLDGSPLAVVYNFACHPIQGVPSKGSTADFPGFASQVIEENLGDSVMAFFVQGCAGDINPVTYKDVHNPRDAEMFGNMLGLNVLRGLKTIEMSDSSDLRIMNEPLSLPRAEDFEYRIASIEAEQARLLKSLRGTSLNFKTFLPLYVQYKVSGEFPSYYSHRYLLDKANGREDLLKLDAENKANMDAYVENIDTMEKLTRLNVNLALLKMHLAQNKAAESQTLDVEVGGLRVGDFVMVTFPGELTVQIGLNIKQASAHRFTFVAGYTNGYIYYTPTDEQRRNTGYAQEDCDTLVAPGWQSLFESKVSAILEKL